MEINPEQLDGCDYMLDIAQELFKTMALQGVSFNNTTLSAPGYSNLYDPNIRISNEIFTATWPGGSPNGNKLESVALGSAPVAQLGTGQTQYRNTLLESRVGDEAFARIPGEIKDYWSHIRSRINPIPPILFAERVAVEHNIPLAIIIGSTVVESAIVEPGERMLHLWYPQHISPKSILASMRRSVRSMISEEMAYFTQPS